jgi:type IV secretory pathway VirB2 component (pilin)
VELIGGFTASQVAIALVAALGSAFVRGLTGFGMAILLVPVRHWRCHRSKRWC